MTATRSADPSGTRPHGPRGLSGDTYRPEPSGRFAAPLTVSDETPHAAAGTGPRSATGGPQATGGAAASSDGVDTSAGAVEAAPEPKASPAARWLVMFIGLLFLCLCGVAVHDILVMQDVVSGGQWLEPVFTWLGDLTFQSWMFPVAIVCAVLALLVLWLVLKPRARTHIGVGDNTAAWMRPVDVARMSTAAARRVHGVLRAHSVATRKKVTVTAVAAVDNGEVERRITEAVTARTLLLASPPTVTVRITTGGESR
ncbi:DUF6286 domain-containing protein [Corynebacterium bovis]|uniref:DUF6286 domain-containing protein n=1 Tax=Corynebacterium bovis TaxID=36808 RepID=UPI00163B0701|nr:DUF6286 domain-containing protein [Corynebacterium bovis]